jgi:hypothetical protein
MITGARTAIQRKGPSLPCKRLYADGKIFGRVLDFGCGKGADVKYLGSFGYRIGGFDPAHQPLIPAGKFDTILCTYVLNVVPPKTQAQILIDLRRFMTRDTYCFITVRRDIPRKGTKTQWWVKLDLPVQYKNSNYVTYYATAAHLEWAWQKLLEEKWGLEPALTFTDP